MSLRIDLHCPLELLDHELVYDDRGRARAYLRLFNLSTERIARIDALIHWTGDAGICARQKLHASSLPAGPRAEFRVPVACDADFHVTGLEMEFSRIGFESGQPDWVGHPGRLVELPVLPAPDGRELNRLMARAGRDAVCFPFRTGKLWLCVCGRPNAYRRRACARCGRERDRVLSDFAMEKVLSGGPIVTPSGDVIELPLMEKKRANPAPADQREGLLRAFSRQRALLIRRTVAMLLLAALLALGAWAIQARRRAERVPDAIPPQRIDVLPSENASGQSRAKRAF